jgi:hypothetical protein
MITNPLAICVPHFPVLAPILGTSGEEKQRVSVRDAFQLGLLAMEQVAEGLAQNGEHNFLFPVGSDIPDINLDCSD